MKTFFKKLFIFLAISLVAISLLATLPTYIIKRNSSFKLNEDITKVVLGHSHPECAYNDSLIANFKNLAESGESYFYTYPKIKKVISDNPQIQTVFIEFSNNQIDSEMDDWIWGFEKMNYYLPTYSPFIKMEDYEILNNYNSRDLLACASISIKHNLFKVLNSDFKYTDEIGGFNSLEQIQYKTDNIQNHVQFDSISEVHLKYLRKIIKYCQSQNVIVYLIRSPQHRDFHYLKNESLFQKIRRNKFSDVEFLDFNTFSVPNEYFADFGHLNHKGANMFSNFISKLIKQGLLESENKEELIIRFIKNHNSAVNSKIK